MGEIIVKDADANAEELDARYLLGETRKAIRTIMVGGQSYQIGSRKLTRANLTELWNAEKELAARVAAEDGSGCGLLDNTFVAVFDGR